MLAITRKIFSKKWLKAFLKVIALVFPVSFLICFSNGCASIDQKDTSIAITDVKCIPNENSSTNVTFSLIVENHTIYDISNTTLYFKCLNASKVIDNHKKFVCNLEVPPNLIKISKYSFVFEDEINKIELESCEYDWLGLWKSYEVWWIVVVGSSAIGLITFEILLWYGMLDWMINSIESYWWALTIGFVTFFMFFGIIIPYFMFGPWTWIPVTMSISAFLFFIFSSTCSYAIYVKTRKNKRVKTNKK